MNDTRQLTSIHSMSSVVVTQCDAAFLARTPNETPNGSLSSPEAKLVNPLVLVGFWLRGVDLNHRPLGYEPNELPDCSTPHFDNNSGVEQRQTALLPDAGFDLSNAQLTFTLDGFSGLVISFNWRNSDLAVNGFWRKHMF